MYKVSEDNLRNFKIALIKSNALLNIVFNNDNLPKEFNNNVLKLIESNKKQIKILTENFNINDN